ncbi:hypothetical protein Pcinc_003278 [Petrolisthes cinctipes]|uniref:Uncharacterized protein n=1 Tax=Petrolisthes cinctipes TaxID=88211 RepID=A0AAE1GJ92_PETCI|nr:hypothetical protein Pcinc_003278 [Petrolisthes cinctipes]
MDDSRLTCVEAEPCAVFSPEGMTYEELRPSTQKSLNSFISSAAGQSSSSHVVDNMINSESVDIKKEASTQMIQEDISVKTEVQHQSPEKQLGEPTVDVLIRNVCSKFSVGRKLDLLYLATHGQNIEYRKKIKGVVLMQLRRPPTSAFITASGEVRCVKSTSVLEARVAARRIARCIQKIYSGHPTTLTSPIQFKKFRLVNVLATTSLPMAIRLNAFAQKYARNGEPGVYEPEVYPGVTYKLQDLRATLNIFRTGRITATAPNVENVLSAIEQMYPKVLEYGRPRTEREMVELQLEQLRRYIKKYDENFLEESTDSTLQ